MTTNTLTLMSLFKKADIVVGPNSAWNSLYLIALACAATWIVNWYLTAWLNSRERPGANSTPGERLRYALAQSLVGTIARVQWRKVPFIGALLDRYFPLDPHSNDPKAGE